MTDLFKKLNVLVRARVNDILGEELSRRGAARRRLLPERLGRDVDREIVALRDRINQALDYEDHLLKRVNELQVEAEKLDAEADTQLSAGREEQARYLVGQLQLTQQRLAMAESDLNEHRIVTQELIQRVNELEAAVADARRHAAQEAAEAEIAEEEQQAVEQSPAAHNPSRLVADVLREMRARIDEMGDLISAREEVRETPARQVEDAARQADVDDDLTRRRDRLSRK